MKVLYPETVIAVIADTEDVNYPVANTQDNHPRKYWKHTSTNGWLRVHCDARSQAVAISGTNATRAEITVKSIATGLSTETLAGHLIDSGAAFLTSLVPTLEVMTYEDGTAMTYEDGTAMTYEPSALNYFIWNHTTGDTSTVIAIDSDNQIEIADDIFSDGDEYSIEIGDIVSMVTIDLGGARSYFELITDTSEAQLLRSMDKCTGYEYGYQMSKHNIIITLYASDTLHAGVVRTGAIIDLPNPQYGMTEGLKDFSIIKDLNNGSPYYLPRFRVRTFSGTLLVERDVDFYRFMRNFLLVNGSSPVFFWIADGMSDVWIVYGMAGMSTGTHSYFKYSEIPFSVTEVI